MNTMEVDDDQSLTNEPLVIHFQPGKLTDFAAVSFAAALLHNKFTHIRRNGGRRFRIHALDLAQVSIPNGIRDTIYQLVDDMEKTWTEWWLHHLKWVFLEHSPSPDSMIDWMDQLVWSYDGTINYERTAKNMLNDDKITITNKQKYQLACSYCFIDDVERLKQTLTQDSIVEETPEFPGLYEGFSGYWDYKFGINYEDTRNLEELICRVHCRHSSTWFLPYDEWPAIEYFFDQLDSEHRLRFACTILGYALRPRLTLYLLPKLTISELDVVIKNAAYNIMHTLVRKCKYVDYTILIWKRMVNIIDDQKLSSIICNVNDLQYEKSYVNPLLWEMWCCLLERQKKHIINEKICDFTGNDFSPNFPLILDFLSRCDPERKYEYWSKHWPYLVVVQLASENRLDIERIIKLCIVDDQKIEDFKKTTMIDYNRIAHYCKYLICSRRIKEIQSYLDFCTSDSQAIRDVKKKIMIGMSKERIFEVLFQRLDDETTNDFNQYLEDIFTENEAKEFLNEMITHPGNLKLMCKELTPGRLKDMMEIVDKFASSEDNLIKVKYNLFERCRLDSTIKKSVVFDLTAWCFDANKTIVEKFKEVSSSIGGEFDAYIPVELRNSGDDIYRIFLKHYRSQNIPNSESLLFKHRSEVTFQ